MTYFQGYVDLSSGKNQTIKNLALDNDAYVVGNESGYTVIVQYEIGSKSLYPGTVDVFRAGQNFPGFLDFIVSAKLSNVNAWPSAFLQVDAVGHDEPFNYGAYPMALPRQMNVGNSVPLNATATAIDNENNAAGTSIIKSIVTGDGANQAVSLTNDAAFILGDAAHPGAITVSTIHNTGSIDAGGAPPVLINDVFRVVGAATFQSTITLNSGAQQVTNGSVSGTISFYTPIWGTGLKILRVDMSNYQSASIATFNLPSALSFWMGLSGNYDTAQTFSLFSGGVPQNMQQLTTLGANGAAGTFGSPSQTNMHSGCFFVSIASVSQFQMGTTASGQTGSIVIVGV